MINSNSSSNPSPSQATKQPAQQSAVSVASGREQELKQAANVTGAGETSVSTEPDDRHGEEVNERAGNSEKFDEADSTPH